MQSIRLLRQAEDAGPRSREAVDALLFARRLWEYLLLQLATEENQLPRQLRADIISVGIALLKEAESIRLGQSKSFRHLIEISQTIADGLQ
jgi:flagellar protein FlaF